MLNEPNISIATGFKMQDPKSDHIIINMPSVFNAIFRDTWISDLQQSQVNTGTPGNGVYGSCLVLMIITSFNINKVTCQKSPVFA